MTGRPGSFTSAGLAPPKRDLGGTLRACEPAETLARVGPALAAVGITRVADVTGLDRIGIPVAMSVRPAARSLSVSQGKGLSRELARISAIMESIELHHAEHVPPPAIVASYREVRRRHQAVDPAELRPGIRWRAYNPRKPIGWVRGADLWTGEPVLVPRARLSLESEPTSEDADVLLADSNGLASGNERWEAICHGLFEVIERDCDWRWHELSGADRQLLLLDNDTIESPLLQSYLERCAGAGVVPRIWDMTSHLGIPAYRCIIRDEQSWRPLGADYGAGCHLSKEIALSRAITEAAQCRLTFIAGARDDLFPSVYARRRARWSLGGAAPLPPGSRDFCARPAPPLAATFEEDARSVIGRLRDGGYRRVIGVDHTRADLGIPVAHVIVPGLRCAK